MRLKLYFLYRANNKVNTNVSLQEIICKDIASQRWRRVTQWRKKQERQRGGWGWSGWGWVNAQNTLHQTKALLRAGCVSSPFMFRYFPPKDKTQRVSEQWEIKWKKIQDKDRAEKEKREGIKKERAEAREWEKQCPICLLLPLQQCWKALPDSLEWLDYCWLGGG